MLENDNDKPTPPAPPANGGNDKMPYEGRADIDDLLAFRGLGGAGVLGFGYGGGYGQGGGGSLYHGNNSLAAEAHADGTARGENIKANRALVSQGLDRISDNFEATFRGMQFSELSREHVDLERRLNDSNRDTTAIINALRAEMAKCCCESKLLATENKSEILAAISVEAKDTLNRELAAANAELIHLRTVNALGDKDGHGR
jgi:hypothetical protein